MPNSAVSPLYFAFIKRHCIPFPSYTQRSQIDLPYARPFAGKDLNCIYLFAEAWVFRHIDDILLGEDSSDTFIQDTHIQRRS